MNARYYVPYLNRFISADTIVPDPTNPQSLNRYSYALNNPIRYSDPSGHCAVDEEFRKQCTDAEPIALVNFTAVAGEVWTLEEIVAVSQGAMLVANALYEASGGKYGSPSETFLKVQGGTVTWHKIGKSCADMTEDDSCFAQTQTGTLIWVFTDIYELDDSGNKISKIPLPDNSDQWAVHELGHAFESRVNGALGVYHVRNQLPPEVDNRNGFAGPFPGWQQSKCSDVDCEGEIFADMYIGWTYGQWSNEASQRVFADLKANFMTTNMSNWIDVAAQR